MPKVNPAARLMVVYAICLIVGQAGVVALGLAIDAMSKTAALAVFIPLYYGMYWVAWRIALWVADREPEARPASAASGGRSSGKILLWLFAPALAALDFCD